ncbi:MAG TPA: pyruvate kinase [Polyangiaceae bacterium]|nr:pyruvate kinase [Polyangiaceae bacterium]
MVPRFVRAARPRQRSNVTKAGDRLLLVPEHQLDEARHAEKKKKKKEPLSVVGCTLHEPLLGLQVCQPVYIEDGRFAARVVELRAEGAVIELLHVPSKRNRIRSDKGLNFPETDFSVSSLTDKDRLDLDFVATHADMIGYSFVQTSQDVDALVAELAAALPEGKPRPTLVLKIETQRAVQNLPALIVQAAGQMPTAVMIARGDLAIELGFQRIAEMQEEILWLCEAAHVPVIWATQVLGVWQRRGYPLVPRSLTPRWRVAPNA